MVHIQYNYSIYDGNPFAALGVLFELDEKDNPWIEHVIGAAFDKVTYKGM